MAAAAIVASPAWGSMSTGRGQRRTMKVTWQNHLIRSPFITDHPVRPYLRGWDPM